MINAKIAVICCCALLASCATKYPQNPEDQAVYHSKELREAILKGDLGGTTLEIDATLNRPGGIALVNKVLSANPQGRSTYLNYLEVAAPQVAMKHEANTIHEKLQLAKSASIISDEQYAALLTQLNKRVADGNQTGSIPYDLTDNIDRFPELKSPGHYRLLIDRTIKGLQGDRKGERSIESLMAYVKQEGKNSDVEKMVESLLPTFNLGRNELDAVAEVYPAYASNRRDEITARVFVQVKNTDRLVADDLIQLIRNRVRGIDLVQDQGPKTTVVVIERLRNDERVLAERSQTITYAQHEVNLLSAALLMPTNSSYIYEIVSGGAEIDYGYAVSAVANGKTVFDEVVRGKISRQYSRCQNSRIQNVFGGITSAGFVANDDMQHRCNGNASVSIDDIRNEIFSSVVDRVLSVPTIKTAHDSN